jgi:hypothetical protein
LPSAQCKCHGKFHHSQSFHSPPNTMPRPDLVNTRCLSGSSYAVIYHSLWFYNSCRWRLDSYVLNVLCCTTQMHTHTHIYIYIYIYICSLGFVNNLPLATTSFQTKPQYNVWNIPRPALQNKHLYPKLNLPGTQLSFPAALANHNVTFPTLFPHSHTQLPVTSRRLVGAHIQRHYIEAILSESLFVLQNAFVCFVLLSLWRRHYVTVVPHHVTTTLPSY